MTEEALKVNLSGIVPESIVDGPGFRFVVFTQGCPHGCKGCHNPETHPFGTGTDVRIERILEEVEKDPLLDGITLSGGEPFAQAGPLAVLAREVKKKGLSVFAFTGYRFEELEKLAEKNEGVRELIDACDFIVDGRFVLEERDLSLKFRGSRNQRIINVPKTLEKGEVVLAEEYM